MGFNLKESIDEAVDQAEDLAQQATSVDFGGGGTQADIEDTNESKSSGVTDNPSQAVEEAAEGAAQVVDKAEDVAQETAGTDFGGSGGGGDAPDTNNTESAIDVDVGSTDDPDVDAGSGSRSQNRNNRGETDVSSSADVAGGSNLSVTTQKNPGRKRDVSEKVKNNPAYRAEQYFQDQLQKSTSEIRQDIRQRRRNYNPSDVSSSNPVSVAAGSAAGINRLVDEAGDLVRPNEKDFTITRKEKLETVQDQKELERYLVGQVGGTLRNPVQLGNIITSGIGVPLSGSAAEATSKRDSPYAGSDFLTGGVVPFAVETGKQVVNNPTKSALGFAVTEGFGSTISRSSTSALRTIDSTDIKGGPIAEGTKTKVQDIAETAKKQASKGGRGQTTARDFIVGDTGERPMTPEEIQQNVPEEDIIMGRQTGKMAKDVPTKERSRIEFLKEFGLPSGKKPEDFAGRDIPTSKKEIAKKFVGSTKDTAQTKVNNVLDELSIPRPGEGIKNQLTAGGFDETTLKDFLAGDTGEKRLSPEEAKQRVAEEDLIMGRNVPDIKESELTRDRSRVEFLKEVGFPSGQKPEDLAGKDISVSKKDLVERKAQSAKEKVRNIPENLIRKAPDNKGLGLRIPNQREKALDLAGKEFKPKDNSGPLIGKKRKGSAQVLKPLEKSETKAENIDTTGQDVSISDRVDNLDDKIRTPEREPSQRRSFDDPRVNSKLDQPDTTDVDAGLEKGLTSALGVGLTTGQDLGQEQRIQQDQTQEQIDKIKQERKQEQEQEQDSDSNIRTEFEQFFKTETERKTDPDSDPDMKRRRKDIDLQGENNQIIEESFLQTEDKTNKEDEFAPSLTGLIFGQTKKVSEKQAQKLNQTTFSGLGIRNPVEVSESNNSQSLSSKELEKRLGI